MKLTLVLTFLVAILTGGYHVNAIDCGCPSRCTDTVLDRVVIGPDGSVGSCEERIEFVMQDGSLSERDACRQIANEFPNACGRHCNPDICMAPRCGCESCDSDALSTVVTDAIGSFTCGSRIDWVIDEGSLSERDACRQVGKEFPNDCGLHCNPDICSAPRCGCSSCDAEALSTIATDQNGGFSCGSRIDWVIDNDSRYPTEEESCREVGRQFPVICGRDCSPEHCDNDLDDWAVLCRGVGSQDAMKSWLERYFTSDMCSTGWNFGTASNCNLETSPDRWCAAAGWSIYDNADSRDIKCCREPHSWCHDKLVQYCPNRRQGDYRVRSSQNPSRTYAC